MSHLTLLPPQALRKFYEQNGGRKQRFKTVKTCSFWRIGANRKGDREPSTWRRPPRYSCCSRSCENRKEVRVINIYLTIKDLVLKCDQEQRVLNRKQRGRRQFHSLLQPFIILLCLKWKLESSNFHFTIFRSWKVCDVWYFHVLWKNPILNSCPLGILTWSYSRAMLVMWRVLLLSSWARMLWCHVWEWLQVYSTQQRFTQNLCMHCWKEWRGTVPRINYKIQGHFLHLPYLLD